MTTRLDRLVLLLSDGPNPSVRQTAARQLGTLAAQRVQHGSVADDWRGVEGEWGEVANLLGRLLPLLRARSWDTRVAASQAVEAICKAVGTWDPTVVTLKGEQVDEPVSPTSALDTFDIKALLDNAETLLAATDGSAPTVAIANGSATNGHATPEAAADGGVDESKLSAREKVALKRKRKAEGKQGGRAAKVQATEANKAAPILPEAQPQASTSTSETVVISHRKPEGGQVKPAPTVTEDWSVPSEQWPFGKIADRIVADLTNASWEARHGAALGLRELLRYQADGAGGFSRSDRQAWTEAVALRLLEVLARDRFGDFVGDHVVAPVRETAAQALAALIQPARASTVQRIGAALLQLIHQRGVARYAWQVRHAGLLGLQYLVDSRADALTDTTTAERCSMSAVVDVAVLGLQDHDDDVRAAAASTLIPLVDQICLLLPHKIDTVLDVLWHCLSDLGDDLASSVAVVMTSLSKLMGNAIVLSHIQAAVDPSKTIASRVPLLYPFVRHTLTAVRLAVVRVLAIFLGLPGEHLTWLDEKPLRLIFQNMVVEEKLEIREASVQAWLLACSILPSGTLSTIAEQVPGWFSLVSTPIGAPPDRSLFWSAPGSASAHNVDGPYMAQNLSLVPVNRIIAGRLAGISALAFLLSRWSVEDAQMTPFAPLLVTGHVAPSMMQRFVAASVIADWAAHLGPTLPASKLITENTSALLQTLENNSPAAYTETAIETQQLSNDAHLLADSLGKMANDVLPANGAFSLPHVEHLRGPVYDAAVATLKRNDKKLAVCEERRRRVDGALVIYGHAKERADVQLFAAVAGAVVSLQATPSKLNPLIKSLMNSVKAEPNEQLQRRSAASLAIFIHRCSMSAAEGRPNPADKVVKNLCVFLCQDPSTTPLFADHVTLTDEIVTLQEQQRETTEADAAGSGDQQATIIARGCEAALAALAETFGDTLLDQLAKLREAICDPLLTSYGQTDARLVDDSGLAIQVEQAQAVVDALTVLRILVGHLRPAARATLSPLFPCLSKALRSTFAVVRNAAARCVTAMCDAAPVEYVRYVVVEILPFAGDTTSVNNRKGVIELIALLIATLDVRILPYIIFFVVPLLGRTTDSDEAIRMLATSTFASTIQLVPLEAGLPDPEGFPEDLLVKRASERQFLSQLLDGSRIEEYVMPVSVNAELRKYQREGVSWMAFLNKFQLHGILCDDMGLGKTLQTICILTSMHHERAERFKATGSPDAAHAPSIVICPPTLAGHWEHEITKYSPNLRPLIYSGGPAQRAALRRKAKECDVYIMTYEGVRSETDDFGGLHFLYCVLDEGHIVKNAKSKLAQAVKRIRSHHRLILTGTPIQNNLLELWSLFDFLMPGFLGTEKTFAKRFSRPVLASRGAKSSSKQQSAGALALEALHKQVLPFLLRRLKEDVLDDLPPKIIQDYYCDLTPLQRELYEANDASGGVKAELENGGEPAEGASRHIFQSLQYLRQLVNHPRLVLKPDNPRDQAILQRLSGSKNDLSESPKLEALRQILQDCGIGVEANGADDEGANHRVLIFCQGQQMLDLVEHTLLRGNMPSVTYMRLDGGTPATSRHGITQAFNADPSIDCLLLTTHIGGLGLNLTGADTVIFVEHDWNPQKDLQAMDRAHRLGQRRVVNVYRLITRDTLEEKIMGLQRFKLNIASSVVTQQNASLATMGTDQVLDLFQLSSPEESGKAKDDGDKSMSHRAIMAGLGDLADQDMGDYAAGLS